jgi:protein SCO1/2
MKSRWRSRFWSILTLAVVLVFPARGPAEESVGSVVRAVGFDQRLGERLPLGLHFRADSGRDLTLGELFGRRPVILAPVYYRCPMLCNQVLSGLTRSLKPLALEVGKDFAVIAMSINPSESSELAAQKKANYLQRYDRPGSESGWHFLTGDQPAITELTRAIGFRYTYNPQTKLYAHAAGVVVATADGRLARYFYGVDFPAKDLQAELERARAGRVGSPIGRLLLLCYDYDAATGKYTLSILRLTRILGTATAAALGGFLLVMFRRERTQRCRGDRRQIPEGR